MIMGPVVKWGKKPYIIKNKTQHKNEMMRNRNTQTYVINRRWRFVCLKKKKRFELLFMSCIELKASLHWFKWHFTHISVDVVLINLIKYQLNWMEFLLFQLTGVNKCFMLLVLLCFHWYVLHWLNSVAFLHFIYFDFKQKGEKNVIAVRRK